MPKTVRIWYVSAQRLCNFKCAYCVSVDDYAKSNTTDWLDPGDQARFEKIVRWIAERPFQVGVRFATLGEPFTSRFFLQQAGRLSQQPNIDYVELLTNGSLLKTRLGLLAGEGDISKISLWITYHPTEIPIPRFIENAHIAQERFGCFVVVNGLLFPDNEDSVIELKRAAEDAGLRFNLDLGYDPRTPHGAHRQLEVMVPVLRSRADAVSRAVELGANPELLGLNMLAMQDLSNESCSAGHDYFYIGIRGDVFRCSRYQALGKEPLGNILDGTVELDLASARWRPCGAGFGCGNKEDFLNLQRRQRDNTPVPSLGWIGSAPSATPAATPSGDTADAIEMPA